MHFKIALHGTLAHLYSPRYRNSAEAKEISDHLDDIEKEFTPELENMVAEAGVAIDCILCNIWPCSEIARPGVFAKRFKRQNLLEISACLEESFLKWDSSRDAAKMLNGKVREIVFETFRIVAQ